MSVQHMVSAKSWVCRSGAVLECATVSLLRESHPYRTAAAGLPGATLCARSTYSKKSRQSLSKHHDCQGRMQQSLLLKPPKDSLIDKDDDILAKSARGRRR